MGDYKYTCLLCGEDCKPSPTKRGWIVWAVDFQPLAGIHHDCVERLWDCVNAIKNAEVMDFDNE